MSDISLKLDERTAEGKHLTKLRKDGFTPSVVYGGHSEPMLTQSGQVETSKVVRAAGKHTTVNLTIGGKKKLAIIKDIDIDPVRHELRHVAFHTIKQNDIITTEVTIELVGEGKSVAEKLGLVILQTIETIEIKAKPADLPESLKLAVADLAKVDDRLTVGDIKLPKGVEFADVDQDMELMVVNVYEPGALQAANEAAGGEAEADTEVEAEKGAAASKEEQAEAAKPSNEAK